jgi:hypothetical protein
VKRTAYRIEGTVDQLPADLCLPDGVTVTEVEVDDPKRVEVTTDGGNTLEVAPWDGGEELVSFAYARATADVLLSLDSARQVRDCLNAILGDDSSSPAAPAADTASALGEDRPKRRVFMDRDDDLWWEVDPDVFVRARWLAYACVYRKDGEGERLAYITDTYGPLADVTAEHPEINEGA